MDPAELELRGLVHRTPPDIAGARSALAIARRDLATASSLEGSDPDWCLAIAYNAMLQAGRALMLSRGLRPAGEAHHVAVVRFAEHALGDSLPDEVLAFERMRRRRHSAVYDAAGSVSRAEAEAALRHARRLVDEVEGELGGGQAPAAAAR